jgi:hypothetical protein
MFADQTSKNVGRPDMEPSAITGKKRYCSHLYQTEDCEKVIELMKQGYSINMVVVELDISLQTLHDWRKSIPEFGKAVDIGIAASQAFYERKALENLINVQEKDGPKTVFNQRLYEFTMKSRFKVTDALPAQVTVQVDKDTSIDKIDDIIKSLHKDTI